MSQEKQDNARSRDDIVHHILLVNFLFLQELLMMIFVLYYVHDLQGGTTAFWKSQQ